MLGMTVKDKREFVLPVPPAWEDIAQGAKEARVLVSLVEHFTYIDVPEVGWPQTFHRDACPAEFHCLGG